MREDEPLRALTTALGTAPANINGREQGNRALSSERYFYFYMKTCIPTASAPELWPRPPLSSFSSEVSSHGLPLYPQNTDTTTLQDDREIPKNVNCLLPHSGNQKDSWRASLRASVCQQMLLCFLRWLTDSNTLAKYKQFNLDY